MIGVRLFVAVALLAITAARSPASAQDYPNKPIKLIVPTAPAGIGDIIARQMQHKLNESGVTVVVENRPGAAGVIGVNEVAKAPADGYTFLVGNHAVLSMLPHLQKIPYDPVKSFTPVFLAVTVPNILVVHPSVPAKDVKELIAYAKANPGKLTYASQGVGASGHIAGELFKLSAGVDITHVPYKGAAPAIQDVVGGQVPTMFVDLAAGSPMIKAGKLRVLGVASPKRITSLPDVPTLVEQGVANFEAWAWQGLVVPAGTPKDVIARLNSEYAKAVGDPGIRQALLDAGIEPFTSTPEEMSTYVKSENEKWARVIKQADIKVE
jgi:tripartite-type tricarboxylate transporter receptor subunit TctC